MSGENKLVSLTTYNELADPIQPILIRSVIIVLVCSCIYVLFGFHLPSNPEFWYPIAKLFAQSKAEYLTWVRDHLTVNSHEKWNRLMLIAYLSMYIGMWMTYFSSKKYPDHDPKEKGSLKIQSLRRLLGHSTYQWQLHTDSTKEDDAIIKSFRRKGEAGMNVIAILIAVSILIFDQISSIWMAEKNLSLWQYSILWFGMFSAMISFICFMMCVDALDTIYNRFSNDSTRNVIIKYFYGFTLNPRYIGGAAMLLSIVLLLGFHSELLGSLAVIVILLVGYHLWFPDISCQLSTVTEMNLTSIRSPFHWYILLLAVPLVVRMFVLLIHA